MYSLDFETLSGFLFSHEALAAISDSEYQHLAATLYAAPYSIRMTYAEVLFRYNRNVETRSLGAFLACVDTACAVGFILSPLRG
jgi:hypothetical protein